MLQFRSSRLTALGIALVWGLTPSVQAGDWFGCCRKTCDTQVNLPAQRVVVQTTAPRVTVQETTRVSRGALTPVIGTVFMPIAFPIGGLTGVRDDTATREDDFNPLRTAHEAEIHQLRHEKAKAALKAEIDAKQRVLSRLGPTTTTNPSTDTTTNGDLDKKVNDLKDKIDKLSDRLTNVEKLLLTHDNYLQEKIQQRPAPEPIGAPMPLKPVKP